MTINKTALNAAFKQLRADGFIALQNHLCCSNCAGCDISNRASAIIDCGQPKHIILGSVFYHKQDTERAFGGRHPQPLAIRYGQLDTEKHGDIGLETKAVGLRAWFVLLSHGLKIEWFGDPNEVIFVLPD